MEHLLCAQEAVRWVAALRFAPLRSCPLLAQSAWNLSGEREDQGNHSFLVPGRIISWINWWWWWASIPEAGKWILAATSPPTQQAATSLPPSSYARPPTAFQSYFQILSPWADKPTAPCLPQLLSQGEAFWNQVQKILIFKKPSTGC